MAIEAITFEENGYVRELTTPGEYRQAILDGRLTRDTVVQCYDASGTFTMARAGEVALLQPIFDDPTPAVEEPEVLLPVPEAEPLPSAPLIPTAASGTPITAEPSSAPPIPPPPQPAPPPPPPILAGDQRPGWTPVSLPPPISMPAMPPRRGSRSCGCALGALAAVLLAIVVGGLFWWRTTPPGGHSAAAAAYTALGPSTTFYVTRGTNLRSDPDISHAPVGRLTRGTEITATRVRSRQGEDYVRIDAGSSAGRFVWGYNVVSDPPPALDTGEAGARRLERPVDILARPAAGSAVLEHRLPGQQVQLAGTVADGQFAEALLAHGVGYIAAADLAGDQPEQPSEQPVAEDDE